MQWPKVDVRLLPAIGLGLLLFSFLFVTSPSSTLARHGRRKGRRHHDVDDANESYAYGATVNVSGWCYLNESTAVRREVDYSCQHFNSSSGFVYLPENTTEGTSTMCESHMYYTDGDNETILFLVSKLELLGSVGSPFMNDTHSQCVMPQELDSNSESSVVETAWMEWVCWDQEVLSNYTTKLVAIPETFTILYLCTMTVTSTSTTFTTLDDGPIGLTSAPADVPQQSDGPIGLTSAPADVPQQSDGPIGLTSAPADVPQQSDGPIGLTSAPTDVPQQSDGPIGLTSAPTDVPQQSDGPIGLTSAPADVPQQKMGRLILMNSSPVVLGNPVVFVVITEKMDSPVMFSLAFGDFVNATFDETDFNRNASNLTFDRRITEQLAGLSFDLQDACVASLQHMYMSVGRFEAYLMGIREWSENQTESNVVYIQHTACSLPEVTLSGGGSSVNPKSFLRSQAIVLYSSFVLDCPATTNVVYEWSVYKGRSDVRPSINLPSKTVLDMPELRLPPCALSYGLHVFRLSVSVFTDLETRSMVTGTAYTWITISPSNLLPTLSGGSAKRIGFGVPIQLDGSLSRDPDVCGAEDQVLEFSWYCTMQAVRSGVASSDLDLLVQGAQSDGVGCQGVGYQLPYNSAQIHVTPVSMTSLPTTYRFILVINKSGRTPAATQQHITLVQGDPPLVSLSCIVNCGVYLNPSQRLVLSASCSNCNSREILSYSWSFIPQSSTNFKQHIDWLTETSTGSHTQNLVVNAGTFSGDIQEQFSFGITSTRPDNTEGYAETTCSTNTAPTGGNCYVWPNEGIVLETKFNITCIGYQDEDLPLSYQYFTLNPRTETVGTVTRKLLHHGYDATSPPVYLSAGLEDNDFTLSLMVVVSDRYGASSQVDLSVIVKEAQRVEFDTLYNLTSGENSALQQMVRTGDVQAATQLIGVVTSILNKQSQGTETGDTDELQQKKSERRALRESMIRDIASMPVQSMESLQQAAAVVSDVTMVTDELTAEAKSTAASTLLILSQVLGTSSADNENSRETVEESGRLILSGLSNLLGTMVKPVVTLTSGGDSSLSDTETDSSSQNATTSEDRNVALATLSALDSVKAALLVSKVAGESATLLQTERLTVQLARTSAHQLAATTLSVGHGGGTSTDVQNKIYLPDNLDVTNLIGEGVEIINTEIVQFRTSPYTWSTSNDLVSSAVSDLVIRANGNEVNISADALAEHPIDIYVPLATSSSTYQPTSVNMTGGTTITIMTNVTQEYSALVLILSINETEEVRLPSKVVLGVTVGKAVNRTDSLDDLSVGNITQTNTYNRSVSLIELVTNVSRPLLITIPAEQLEGTGEYAVRLRMHYMPEDSDPLQLDVRLLDYYCLYWKEDTETWAPDGCTVGPNSGFGHLHCACNHLTSFAGGVLIMPNTFDFSTEFAKFSSFWKNPVAIAFVVCLLVIYVLLVVWARRKDRQDVLKGNPIDLADNHPLAEYPYAVAVYTGSRRGAGTTATVALMLIGDLGRCSAHLLKEDGTQSCTGDSVDIFIVRTRKPLGRIRALRLWHNNKGKHPEWFVSRVIVEDLPRSQKYTFLCDSWLSSRIGDGQVDRTFGVASDSQVKEFGHLFRSRSSRGIRDNHLWFSVITRPVRSIFTRVQRLTCCLGLLMSYMLSNIMFYGADETSQGMDIGPAVVSLSQIIIGLQSAILVFPTNVLIVQLFRCSHKSLPKNNYLETLRDKFWRRSSRTAEKDVLDLADVHVISVSSTVNVQHYTGIDHTTPDSESNITDSSQGVHKEESRPMFYRHPVHDNDLLARESKDPTGLKDPMLPSKQAVCNEARANSGHNVQDSLDQAPRFEHHTSPVLDECTKCHFDPMSPPPLYDEYFHELPVFSNRSIASHQSSHQTPTTSVPHQVGLSVEYERIEQEVPRRAEMGSNTQNTFKFSNGLRGQRLSKDAGLSSCELEELDAGASEKPSNNEGVRKEGCNNGESNNNNNAGDDTDKDRGHRNTDRQGQDIQEEENTAVEDDGRTSVVTETAHSCGQGGTAITEQTASRRDQNESNTCGIQSDTCNKHANQWTQTAMNTIEDLYLREESLANEIRNILQHVLDKVDAYRGGRHVSKRQVEPIQSVYLGTYAEPTTRSELEEIGSEDEADEPRRSCLSCAWCRYVAWTLVVLIILVCSFFTILYSFSYGRSVTISWLKSFLFSFTTDVLVEQPLKALVLAFIFSAILRRSDDDRELVIVKEWKPEHSTDEPRDEANAKWERQRLNPAYIPPNKRSVFIDGKQKREQSRLYSVLREFGGYFVFMYLVLLIAHGMRDRNIYRTNAHMKNVLFKTKQYNKVTSVSTFWTWLNTSFIDGLYPTVPMNATVGDHVDGRLLIGSPVLRQLRVRDTTCPTLPVETSLFPGTCKPTYSEDYADTRDYLPDWQIPPNSSSLDCRLTDCWKYESNGGYRVRGVTSLRYPTGGYIRQLGRSREQVVESLNYLYNNLWIDKGTAAVITEAVFYNVDTNLLTVMTCLVELPNVGGIFRSHRIESMRLYQSTHGAHVLVLAFEIVYCLYTLSLLVLKICQMVKMKSDFFRKIWNWVDLSIAMLSLAAIGVYVQHTLEVDKVVKTYRRDSSVTFERVQSLDFAFVIIMASIVMLGTVKFLHIIRFNARIFLFARLITDAAPLLVSYAVILVVFKVAFSMLFHLLLGTFAESFRSVTASIRNLLVVHDLLVDKSFFVPFYHLHHIVGPLLMSAYYMFNRFILINLVVSMLIETMRRFAHFPIPDEDVDFMTHMIERLRHWMKLKTGTGGPSRPAK